MNMENAVRNALACNSCLEAMFPPVKLCVSGHSFCSSCFEKMNLCCICDKEKSDARNFALEELIKKLSPLYEDKEPKTKVFDVAIQQSQEVKTLQKKIEDGDEMKDDLCCIVCLQIWIPPIKMCIMGHSYCKSCFKKTACCPICRSEKAAAQNHSLERLAGNFEFACTFAEDGCTFIADGATLREHAVICIYRPYKCLLERHLNCEWKGLFKNALAHCKERHPNYVCSTDDLQLSVRSFKSCSLGKTVRLFEAFDNIFRVVLVMDFEDRCGLIIVGNWIPSDNPKHFNYTLQLLESAKDSLLANFLIEPIGDDTPTGRSFIKIQQPPPPEI